MPKMPNESLYLIACLVVAVFFHVQLPMASAQDDIDFTTLKVLQPVVSDDYTRRAFDQFIESQIGDVSLEKGEGNYWIVHLGPANPHANRRHLKHHIETNLFRMLTETTRGYEPVELEAAQAIPPIVWLGSKELLDKVLRLRSPWAVDTHEYAVDLEVRSALTVAGIELPTIRYLDTSEDRDSEKDKLPFTMTLVHAEHERLYSLEELIDVYRVLRPFYDSDRLANGSDHLRHVYAFVDLQLRQDLSAGFRHVETIAQDAAHLLNPVVRQPNLWRDISLTVDPMLSDLASALDGLEKSEQQRILRQTRFTLHALKRLAIYLDEDWFAADVALLYLRKEGDEINQQRYQTDGRYRELVWQAVPEIAVELDRAIALVDEANRAIWSQLAYIAHHGTYREDLELEDLVSRAFGIDLRLQYLTQRQIYAIQEIAVCLIEGFNVEFFMHDRFNVPPHFNGPDAEIPTALIKMDRRGGEPQLFRLIDLLTNAESIDQGIRRSKTMAVTGGHINGIPLTRFIDEKLYHMHFNHGPLIFSETQLSYFNEHAPEYHEALNSQWNFIVTGTLFGASLPLGGLAGLSGRAATSLVFRGALFYAGGVTLVAAARSVVEGRVILPSARNLTVDSLQFGLMLGTGGALGAFYKKAMPKLAPLLANTLGMVTSASAVSLASGESLAGTGVAALKLSAYTLFGGFADILGQGATGVLSGGVRVCLANTAVTGVGAALEYELGGYTDTLGYPAESLMGAVGISIVESAFMDVSGARASGRGGETAAPIYDFYAHPDAPTTPPSANALVQLDSVENSPVLRATGTDGIPLPNSPGPWSPDILGIRPDRLQAMAAEGSAGSVDPSSDLPTPPAEPAGSSHASEARVISSRELYSFMTDTMEKEVPQLVADHQKARKESQDSRGFWQWFVESSGYALADETVLATLDVADPFLSFDQMRRCHSTLVRDGPELRGYFPELDHFMLFYNSWLRNTESAAGRQTDHPVGHRQQVVSSYFDWIGVKLLQALGSKGLIVDLDTYRGTIRELSSVRDDPPALLKSLQALPEKTKALLKDSPYPEGLPLQVVIYADPLLSEPKHREHVESKTGLSIEEIELWPASVQTLAPGKEGYEELIEGLRHVKRQQEEGTLVVEAMFDGLGETLPGIGQNEALLESLGIRPDLPYILISSTSDIGIVFHELVHYFQLAAVIAATGYRVDRVQEAKAIDDMSGLFGNSEGLVLPTYEVEAHLLALATSTTQDSVAFRWNSLIAVLDYFRGIRRRAEEAGSFTGLRAQHLTTVSSGFEKIGEGQVDLEAHQSFAKAALACMDSFPELDEALHAAMFAFTNLSNHAEAHELMSLGSSSGSILRTVSELYPSEEDVAVILDIGDSWWSDMDDVETVLEGLNYSANRHWLTLFYAAPDITRAHPSLRGEVEQTLMGSFDDLEYDLQMDFLTNIVERVEEDPNFRRRPNLATTIRAMMDMLPEFNQGIGNKVFSEHLAPYFPDEFDTGGSDER